MIGRSFTLRAAVAGFSALFLASGAIAADLGRPGSFKDDYRPYSPMKRYYVAIRGGVSFPDDTDFNTALGNVVNSYDEGYNISGVIGMVLTETPNFIVRGDLELGYREADVDTHTVGGTRFSSGNSFGDTSTFFGLANLTVDIKTGTPFMPYLTAGGGFANVEFNGHGVNLLGAPTTVMDDDDTVYALQLGAGLNYKFSEAITFGVGYRYFAAYDVSLTSTAGAGSVGSEIDVEDHQLLFNLRTGF